MLSVIAYQTTLTFWTAAFPGLARNTPQLRTKAEELTNGTISRDEYDYADTLQRSRLSNMAFYIQSCGEVVILALIVGVLFGVHVTASQANNNYGLSVLIAFATGVWVLLAMPWFILEKRRPGQPLPPNMNIVMVGLWQLYRAITQIWRLKQSLIYLIGIQCREFHLNRVADTTQATSCLVTHLTLPLPSSPLYRTRSLNTIRSN